MARAGKTEPVAVCLDADVVIAGLFSTSGASHAVLLMGEIGLISVVLPEQVVEEVRRNVSAKLPEALPGFERFLAAIALSIVRPTPSDLRRTKECADEKDRPVLAAALTSGAGLLVTHNVRHFRTHEEVRVLRPRVLMDEARAWMTQIGD